MTDTSAMTCPILESCVIVVVADADRVWCAEAARGLAQRAGLSERSRWEVAIAVAELVSNAVKFANGGELTLIRSGGVRPTIEVELRDRGPGIADTERALSDGFSEWVGPGVPVRGLGAGLGAVRRLMSTLEVHSIVGQGTTIRAAKWEVDAGE